MGNAQKNIECEASNLQFLLASR